MTIAHFSFPTTVHFGAGASKMAGVNLRERRLRRPLIVTDRALAALPVMKSFVAHLDTGLDVGGTRVTVTACAGSGTPQTFTCTPLSRAIAAGSKLRPTGEWKGCCVTPVSPRGFCSTAVPCV